MAAIKEIISTDLETVEPSATVQEAAEIMRRNDVGDVLVVEGDRLRGIITDRDIAIRAVAEGRDPSSISVDEIASKDLVTVSPTDSVQTAVRVMREKAVRRLPVVDNGRPVGIVSLGDLAVDRDPESALADISAAEPNE